MGWAGEHIGNIALSLTPSAYPFMTINSSDIRAKNFLISFFEALGVGFDVS